MRKLLFGIALMLVTPFAHSQQRAHGFAFPLRSNLDIGLRCGTGAVTANASMFNPTVLGTDVGFDLGYTYYFNNNWGVHIGADIVYCRNGYHFEAIESSVLGTIDLYDDGSTITRPSHYTLLTQDVHQNNTSLFAEVPLQISYRHDHLQLNVGLKFIMPLSIAANYQYGTTEVGVGYDIDGTGSHLDIPIPCGTLEPQNGSYSFLENTGYTFPLLTALSFDAGYRIPLTMHRQLYLGFYVDYSLTHIGLDGEDELVTFNNGEPLFNNIAQTHHLNNWGYAALGIKIQYGFGFGKHASYHRSSATPNKLKNCSPRRNKQKTRKHKPLNLWYN